MARFSTNGYGIAGKIHSLRHALAKSAEHDKNLELDVYNDGQKSSSERAPHYMRHADLFATAIISSELTLAPIKRKRLVRLIDTEQSLGAQTENYFAKVLGIRVMKVAIAHIGDDLLPNNFSRPQLVSDVETIIRFGGHIFDSTSRTEIVLVPSTE